MHPTPTLVSPDDESIGLMESGTRSDSQEEGGSAPRAVWFILECDEATAPVKYIY
jgi:hypothetical protein